jgi:Mor family transcriptional regulator
MAKRTINAKDILADIKAGMNNAALMEKYGLSEKGLRSVKGEEGKYRRKKTSAFSRIELMERNCGE